MRSTKTKMPGFVLNKPISCQMPLTLISIELISEMYYLLQNILQNIFYKSISPITAIISLHGLSIANTVFNSVFTVAIILTVIRKSDCTIHFSRNKLPKIVPESIKYYLYGI